MCIMHDMNVQWAYGHVRIYVVGVHFKHTSIADDVHSCTLPDPT
jgi:hypothetical protein